MPQINGVEKIHILAHSRGTAVVTTALRELIIETRASGRETADVLKIDNLILAAPDLDIDVVTQRLIAEKFGPAFGQITVYTNTNDSALGLAGFIAADLRFGKLQSNELGEDIAEVFRGIPSVNFINVEGVSGLVGHTYFRKHRGALADIVTVLSTSAYPGTSQRPLQKKDGNFWALTLDYQPTLSPPEPSAPAGTPRD